MEDDQGLEKPTVAVLSKRESGPKQGDTGKEDKSNVTRCTDGGMEAARPGGSEPRLAADKTFLREGRK